MDFDTRLEHLVFPERMTKDGLEFIRAHGIESVPLGELIAGAEEVGDGIIKIKHTCEKLTKDGRCSIYEQRPEICRAFDCSGRYDCPCMGTGKMDLVPIVVE